MRHLFELGRFRRGLDCLRKRAEVTEVCACACIRLVVSFNRSECFRSWFHDEAGANDLYVSGSKILTLLSGKCFFESRRAVSVKVGRSFMSERVISEPENTLYRVMDLGNLTVSESTLSTYILEVSRKKDSAVVINSPNSIKYRIRGYEVVTYFYFKESQPNKLITETFFLPLSGEIWSWIDIFFLLILSFLVFFLPEWYLGAIMVSCVLYFAGSFFLRNAMAALRIKRFVRSLAFG